jgi:hypothetical protein
MEKIEIELLKHLDKLKPEEREDLCIYFERKYKKLYNDEPSTIKLVIDGLARNNLIQVWSTDYTDLGKDLDNGHIYGCKELKADNRQIKAKITFEGINYLFQRNLNSSTKRINRTQMWTAIVIGAATIAYVYITWLTYAHPHCK